VTLGGPEQLLLLEATVTNPNTTEDGMLLNNVLVTVNSLVTHSFLLVPEFAINVSTASQDTTWDCNGADEACNDACPGVEGSDEWQACHADCWSQYCANEYYEWLGADNQIDSNYLPLQTNSHGIARVYVYAKCLPTTCGVLYGVDSEWCTSLLPEGCSTGPGEISFSTGVDFQSVKFTSSITPPDTTTSSSLSALSGTD
jgi:hypothetical protein